MHDTTTIEFATLADVVEIGEMSRKYIEYDLGWDYTPEKITRLIRSKTRNVVVARENCQLVGFGIMTYREQLANLDLLAVKIRHRYCGIGSWIVQWLEEVARTAGIFTVYVQVRQNNTGAIKFYKKLDYRIIDEQHGYYRGRETAVILSKDLRHKT